MVLKSFHTLLDSPVVAVLVKIVLLQRIIDAILLEALCCLSIFDWLIVFC